MQLAIRQGNEEKMQVCQIRHEREPSTRKQETASDETKKITRVPFPRFH